MTQTVTRVAPGIWTPEEMRQWEAIRKGQYFLVRQGTLGEMMRCKRCGSKHTYLTWMCVERPFKGLTTGLYAYWRSQPGGLHRGDLRPEEQRNLGVLDQIIGGQAADLASAHPRMAQALNTGQRNADIGGVALGALEPITTAKAQQLVDAVNMRAGRPILSMATLDH